jgi:hypothetical protein
MRNSIFFKNISYFQYQTLAGNERRVPILVYLYESDLNKRMVRFIDANLWIGHRDDESLLEEKWLYFFSNVQNIADLSPKSCYLEWEEQSSILHRVSRYQNCTRSSSISDRKNLGNSWANLWYDGN